ncbi:MAG: aspartate aminotransferase family protein [Clostridia bacterium]|nr:aspartate aminotransferase family protein [Clostridia bacterium]
MFIKETDKQFVANTYGRFDVALVRGNGEYLYDENGKEYIDLGSGIAVNTFGAADSQWVAAVTQQLMTLQHTSNLYYTEPCAKLAQMLCERTGMKKVFFSNSGAEANECMIKAARKYSHDKYGDGRNTIVTLRNSFHGRTVTTLSATGQDVFHQHFFPFTEGFIHITANEPADLDVLRNDKSVCAIMMETIQGEGGVNVLREDYIKEVAAICAEKDILLLFDEVQTGNGRTGKLFSYMHYGVTPDIFSTAKGLAGGLPMGATVFNEKTESVLVAGTHGSTFGGNPVCAAGAVNVMSRLTDELLDEVAAKGQFIREAFAGAVGVVGVYGKGLMLGIETEVAPAEIVKRCLERGVLVLTAKNKVRLLPPLNISYEALEKAIAIIKEVIAQ